MNELRPSPVPEVRIPSTIFEDNNSVSSPINDDSKSPTPEVGTDSISFPVPVVRNNSMDKNTVSRALLKSVSTTATELDDTEIENIKSLIQEGADPCCVCAKADESALHKIAFNWGTDMADLVTQRGMFVDVQDSCGRTPLHMAARSNNVVMVKWLLDHQANIEMRTNKESQTPLHYASRFDSIESIATLLDYGAKLEVKDYRGRSPLHLAVNLGRKAAASYLISLPTPAQIGDMEKNGDMAISAMIKTMPTVAFKALDQLHQIDVCRRRESFLLSYLEPDIKDGLQDVKSPFATIVTEKQGAVLLHPVMQAQLATKWRFIQVYFGINLSLYLLFLLIWTGIIVYPTAQEQHIYTFPRDVYRLVLQFILFVLFALVVLDQAAVIVISSKRQWQYRKSIKDKLNEDLNTLILTDEERDYLKENYTLPSFVPDQAKDLFTIVGLMSDVLTLATVFMHISDIAAHTEGLAADTARVASFATILLWMHVIKFMRAVPLMGSLIAVIVDIGADIFRYFVLALIIFIPYVISFWIVYGGDQYADNKEIQSSTVRDISTPYHIAVMAFRMIVIDSYPYDDLRLLDPGTTFLLIAPYLLIMAVIGLNLFVAVLTNTFQKVQDDALANTLLQRATLIASIEEKFVCKFVYKSYYGYVRSKGNPLIKKYRECDKIQITQKEDEISVPLIENTAEGDEVVIADGGSNDMTQELAVLQKKVDVNINNLKNEIIGTVTSMIMKGRQKQELSFPTRPPGVVRSQSHGFSRRKKRATLKEKEWERKIQSTVFSRRK